MYFDLNWKIESHELRTVLELANQLELRLRNYEGHFENAFDSKRNLNEPQFITRLELSKNDEQRLELIAKHARVRINYASFRLLGERMVAELQKLGLGIENGIEMLNSAYGAMPHHEQMLTYPIETRTVAVQRATSAFLGKLVSWLEVDPTRGFAVAALIHVFEHFDFSLLAVTAASCDKASPEELAAEKNLLEKRPLIEWLRYTGWDNDSELTGALKQASQVQRNLGLNITDLGTVREKRLQREAEQQTSVVATSTTQPDMADVLSEKRAVLACGTTTPHKIEDLRLSEKISILAYFEGAVSIALVALAKALQAELDRLAKDGSTLSYLDRASAMNDCLYAFNQILELRSIRHQLQEETWRPSNILFVMEHGAAEASRLLSIGAYELNPGTALVHGSKTKFAERPVSLNRDKLWRTDFPDRMYYWLPGLQPISSD